MQTLENFEIKRSGATMTISGTDENGKPRTISGFYLVYQMKLEDGSKAIVAANKDQTKSVLLGAIIPPK